MKNLTKQIMMDVASTVSEGMSACSNSFGRDYFVRRRLSFRAWLLLKHRMLDALAKEVMWDYYLFKSLSYPVVIKTDYDTERESIVIRQAWVDGVFYWHSPDIMGYSITMSDYGEGRY